MIKFLVLAQGSTLGIFYPKSDLKICGRGNPREMTHPHREGKRSEKIEQSVIDGIKASVDLVSVIGSRGIELKRNGKGFLGRGRSMRRRPRRFP